MSKNTLTFAEDKFLFSSKIMKYDASKECMLDLACASSVDAIRDSDWKPVTIRNKRYKALDSLIGLRFWGFSFVFK